MSFVEWLFMYYYSIITSKYAIPTTTFKVFLFRSNLSEQENILFAYVNGASHQAEGWMFAGTNFAQL